MEHPILIISMVEDVKGRGGSGYVVKRTVQYWRIGFIAISIMMLLSVSGCSDTHLEDEQVVESEIAVQDQQQNVKDNEDEIIEICSQLYKKLQRRIK